jgi:hypothetical protein
LNDYELTRKDPNTGEYLDTCSNCTRSVKEALQDFEEPPYKHDIGVDNELFE